ncbi:stromal interaction molecule 1 isoform X2 [Aplysia californica]|uniref:Stromal interaction molecule 1 isoform X2 n=1 Tax=Aplysia californica TaxID=6500 RepID=A0ABM0K6J3_APLCA|nr:stromal interaction molecule 1 isoform X2 [Aplysia californica]
MCVHFLELEIQHKFCSTAPGKLASFVHITSFSVMKRLCYVLKPWTRIGFSHWLSFAIALCLICGSFGANDEEILKVDVVAGSNPSANPNLIARQDSVSNDQHRHGGKSSPVGSGSSNKADIIDCHDKAPDECERDRLGLEAIRVLHLMLDDDHNGNVDQSESDEFLRDELQYTDGFERQALFHNNDKLISVDDLWTAWKYSKVYNWTVDDVVEWLAQDVDLPMYVQVFHSHNIDGSYLPRLVNSTSSLLATLGIRNPVHKQKLSLKAMDTVLFGAPKRVHSYAKDLLLISLIIVAFGGCWFLCLHNRYSQTQVKKMMKDLEALQKAEDALKKLSKELAEAERNQKSVSQEKQEELRVLRQNSLRLQVPPARVANSEDRSPSSLSREGSVVRRKDGERRLQQAEEELATLREALSEAESKLELQQHLESQWSAPVELQAWLQLTHELEQSHYHAKRQAAERQLLMARDGCDKIKKRNKAFLGSLRMAHSNSLDDIDQSILDARAALEEVKHDLQERLHRWNTMELLCGFSIISNPGLAALKQALGRDPSGSTGSSGRVPSSLLAPVSIDEADEDLPPADDSDKSIYHKIPERQRQQIYAWARRSRLNWMMKNKSNANFPTGGLSSSGSKTFLNKQALAGSTGSLSHLGPKVPQTSGGHGVNSHHHHHHHQVGKQDAVSFHLGESSNNQNHERSHSNASLSHLSGGQANGAHSHQPPRSPAPYTSSLSYPPYSHTAPSQQQGLASGMSHSQSMTLSSHSSSAALSPGNSTKMFSSASGNHLGLSSGHQSHHHHHHQHGTADSRELTGSNGVDLSNGAGAEQHQQQQGSGGVVSSQPLQVMVGNHHHHLLDDSDGASWDSLPRNHSTSVLSRGRLDRSPELDLSSLDTDSIYSATGGHSSAATTLERQKKGSKKKKFLPNFLQKNKNKMKSS